MGLGKRLKAIIDRIPDWVVWGLVACYLIHLAISGQWIKMAAYVVIVVFLFWMARDIEKYFDGF